MTHLIQAHPLTALVARIIQRAGSSEAEALQVAQNLVLANLSGHDSHGVGMVPRYVDAVLEGGLVPNTLVKVNLDSGTLLGLDGQRGFGQIVGVQAITMGIERAKQHGSCVVALGHAHHLGRIGHFAEMAVAEGLVSLHFVNVMARAVVSAWGGGDGRYGTNPCCIGIPVGSSDQPFILDFATSRVAQGKMRVAYNKGEAVPDGYLIDEKGQPTHNPAVVVVPQNSEEDGVAATQARFGAILPFGEHKGFGLGVACELLAGALCGGGTWHRAADNSRAVYNSMLTILISPELLGTQHSLALETRQFLDWLKASPAASGFSGVQTAGEPERAYRAKRTAEGIAIDTATWDELSQAAQKVGVSIEPY